MTFTFTRFMRACQVQGLNRNTLAFKGWGQPYVAYYAFTGCFVMTFISGYPVFLPGMWDIPTFFFSYTMIGVFPILFIGWKVLKKTKWLQPEEVDLLKDLDEIEAYTRSYVPPLTRLVPRNEEPDAFDLKAVLGIKRPDTFEVYFTDILTKSSSICAIFSPITRFKPPYRGRRSTREVVW